MLESLRQRFGWFYRMRSIYLFISLIVFISMMQFVDTSVLNERMAANLLNMFVLVAAVAAVGRTRFSFVLALLLTLPVVGFQWLGLSEGNPIYMLWSWALGALFYLVTLVYLLRYVFSAQVMTGDKLFGAGAAYMLLGLLWSYFYSISQYFDQR